MRQEREAESMYTAVSDISESQTVPLSKHWSTVCEWGHCKLIVWQYYKSNSWLTYFSRSYSNFNPTAYTVNLGSVYNAVH